MSELINKHCVPCEGGVQPLTKQAIEKWLQQIPGWAVEVTGVKHIYREFPFKNYYHVMAFVNAVAWMAHQENHHPDLEVGYNRCVVRYSTHAIGGLSENDFICAAKVSSLLKADEAIA